MKKAEITAVKAQRDTMKGHAKHLVSGTNAPVMQSAIQNNLKTVKKSTGKSITSVGVC